MTEDRKINANEIDEEFLQDFIIETLEHLELIEMNVLALETGENTVETIDSLFRAFHSIKGIAGFVDQELILKIAHKSEEILDLCRKNQLKINKTISNYILESADIIGNICNDISLLSKEDFIKKSDKFLKELEDFSANNKSDDKGINQDNIIVDKKREKQSSTQELSSIIRIPTKKVDNLVDMMGELLINQSQLEQEAREIFNENDSFTNKLLNMSRIMKELQSLSMSLRMVSLKPTFNKIARIARDTIDELNKEVDFIIEGEDTEIDRNIAEKIFEPLVHLVKNSISHGIESSEIRNERGKSRKGNVRVSAYSNKGSVYIEIQDDGNGIDIERVYQKALEKKLIEESQKYTQEEILDFIFRPGFSTRESVNTVSGRGVGMDVVKTELSAIGGKIEIINKVAEGCTFQLKIPINMAVMNGTIIRLGVNKYILPTLSIKEIVQIENKNSIEIRGSKLMVKVRDSLIPLVETGNLFKEDCEKDRALFVIIEMDKRIKALPVDDILDRREIVVKPLTKEFSSLDYISGASILGDGKVALILDVEFLFKNKIMQENKIKEGVPSSG